MQFNPPYKIRAALYIVTALGSPLVAYLLARHIIGQLELNLWIAEITAVSIMAGLNVQK